MQIPIFVLHVMEGDGDAAACRDYYAARQGVVASKLTSLGLSFEIVPAVNGNALTPEQNALFLDEEESRKKYNGFVLAPYQKGCMLSHISLYERIVREGIEEALILEDDAVVEDVLPDVLEDREHFPSDRGVTLLFHFGTKGEIAYRLPTGHRVIRFLGPPAGTVGYLITLNGAKKLLERAFPIQIAADGLTGTSENLYGITPWVVGHKGFDENIGYV